jgi:hypothetical protein
MLNRKENSGLGVEKTEETELTQMVECSASP